MTLEEFRQQTRLLPGETEIFISTPRQKEDKPVEDILWAPAQNKLAVTSTKGGEK